jgi:hypothetical protein
METLSEMYVLLAVPAGFALHRVLFRSRVRSGPKPRLPPRLLAVVVPLIGLLLWAALCFGFKLLTWKPFAGDTPGSVALTNGLLLTGSALAGVWISARLK